MRLTRRSNAPRRFSPVTPSDTKVPIRPTHCRLADGARLVLASHNPGKLAELTDLLRPHAVTVISAGALGLAEPPEDAPDFVGNARIKAPTAAKASGLPALADDSGFCVAALNGAPGVHSRAGQVPTGILRPRWRGCSLRSRPRRIGAPGLSPPCASPGLTATPRPSSAPSMGTRQAAVRRQKFWLRSNIPANGRDAHVRGVGTGRRNIRSVTARWPSRSSWQRAWARACVDACWASDRHERE
jgi:hypothetical protein